MTNVCPAVLVAAWLLVTILGRIAGLSDEATSAASTPAEREAIIKAAIERK